MFQLLEIQNTGKYIFFNLISKIRTFLIIFYKSGLEAIAAIIDEFNPPDRKTPHGTSVDKCRSTAFVKFLRNSILLYVDKGALKLYEFQRSQKRNVLTSGNRPISYDPI